MRVLMCNISRRPVTTPTLSTASRLPSSPLLLIRSSSACTLTAAQDLSWPPTDSTSSPSSQEASRVYLQGFQHRRPHMTPANKHPPTWTRTSKIPKRSLTPLATSKHTTTLAQHHLRQPTPTDTHQNLSRTPLSRGVKTLWTATSLKTPARVSRPSLA